MLNRHNNRVSIFSTILATFLVSIILLTPQQSAFAEDFKVTGPALFNGVAINDTHIVFGYVDQLWSVPRTGGEAKLIETGIVPARRPCFSPDGSTLAFWGQNNDVFIVPFDDEATTGTPKQLTWHPKPDAPLGWSADGQQVLFFSRRDGDGFRRLYTIGIDGLKAEPLPLPKARDGSLSPDGTQIAYTPVGRGPDGRPYRMYRGGLTSPLWIADLETSRVRVLADNTCNHDMPMWIDDQVFVVSDESGTYNLHVYDVETGNSEQLTSFEQFGIKYASHNQDTIAFIRDGFIHTYDISSKRVEKIEVELQISAPEMEKRQVSAANYLTSMSLSPDGSQLVMEVRGEIIQTNVKTGSFVNLTGSSDVADRNPVWSPDGDKLAWFSDEGGEYSLRVMSLGSDKAIRKIKIEDKPTFYWQPTWSPDSKRITFGCLRLGLWLVDVEAERSTRIDTSNYLANRLWNPNWSPNGRYLTYTRGEPNHIKSVFIYDTQNQTRHQITHDLPCTGSVFDQSGKYLYFIASDSGPLAAANGIWGLLSAIQHRPLVTKKLFAVTLQDDIPAPLHPLLRLPHPEADFVTPSKEPINFEGISQRIVPLPGPSRDFTEIAAGKPGTVYLRYNSYPHTPGSRSTILTPLYRRDLTKPNDFKEIVDDVDSFTISANGESIAHSSSSGLFVQPATPREGETSIKIDLDSIQITIDPVQEWRQIYAESWRMMRDYFYDESHHGQDLDELSSHYESYLEQITRREDLNWLIEETLGNVGVSHLVVSGGDVQMTPFQVPRAGDLGAIFEVHNDRYRFTKIYKNGHPMRANAFANAAPLGQPGVKVNVGDYLLKVNGTEVTASQNLFKQLNNTANRPTRITVGPNIDGTESREMIVFPTTGTNTVRTADIYRQNRERVAQASDGRLAYIVIGDLTRAGISEFTRQYLTGSGKEGVIIDQRWSPGGFTSDRFVQMLTTGPYHRYAYRHGDDLTVPTSLIEGPRVMLINEHNGSASETLPYMFKIAGAGTLVGKRTFGAGVGGSLNYHRLVDNGRITIPNRAAYNPRTGTWMENHGVEPDIEVEWWPHEWRAGRDPQLEKAIEVAMKQLNSNPKMKINRPNYHPGTAVQTKTDSTSER